MFFALEKHHHEGSHRQAHPLEDRGSSCRSSTKVDGTHNTASGRTTMADRCMAAICGGMY